MREIKFRAWYEKEKRFLSWDELQDGTENLQTYFNNELSDVSPLMQYTGLKDKNGKEIYEGDIVKYKSFRKEFISKVIQDLRLGTGHYIKGEHVGFYSINESTVKNFEIEVIGNIYENPELLEVDLDE